MNKNINLCEILRGLEGIELHSTIHGKVILKEVADTYTPYPIRCTIVSNNKTAYFTSEGKYFLFVKEANAECMLFPSEIERNWSKFENPIPEGTPMMCSDLDDRFWTLKFYYCLIPRTGGKYQHTARFNESTSPAASTYMIPYNKFNPNNIEESLKYNIQK